MAAAGAFPVLAAEDDEAFAAGVGVAGAAGEGFAAGVCCARAFPVNIMPAVKIAIAVMDDFFMGDYFALIKRFWLPAFFSAVRD